MFESNVIYIGTKTIIASDISLVLFESNVIYIGTKTFDFPCSNFTSLRVM